MNAFERAQNSIKRITSDSKGFTRDIVFSTPDQSVEATIKGVHSKHHFTFDSTGAIISSVNTHIAFSEEVLHALDYPIRDINGDVNIVGHFVSVKDSTGINYTYRIQEAFPDETIGLIKCLVEFYAQD